MSTTDPNTELVQTPAPSAPPPSSTEAAAPAIDPAEYDRLQREVAEAQAAFETLSPHAARIRRLVENPRYAEAFDSTVKALETLDQSREPQVDDNVRPIYEKVSKLEKFVDNYEATQREAYERPQREFTNKFNEWQNSPANNRFFQRVVADHPDLRPRDFQYLAQVAAESNFEPLEAVWKKESWRFVKGDSSAPPSSLRADAGEIGGATPGTTAQGDGQTMRQRIVQLERARRGISA